MTEIEIMPDWLYNYPKPPTAIAVACYLADYDTIYLHSHSPWNIESGLEHVLTHETIHAVLLKLEGIDTMLKMDYCTELLAALEENSILNQVHTLTKYIKLSYPSSRGQGPSSLI